MSLYFIPVADALPAFEEHYQRWPGDGPPSAEEARDFIEMFLRFQRASHALLRYAVALSGCPSEN
jgi:hypothetical protein